MIEPMKWADAATKDALSGQWVALEDCRYDRHASEPSDGTVVDADEDLTELCGRIREAGRGHCAIVFCEEAPQVYLRSDSNHPASENPIALG